MKQVAENIAVKSAHYCSQGLYRSWKSLESPGIHCRNFQGLEKPSK